MPARLVCPNCQAVLSVREDAPARITCLRCLATVINPNAVKGEVPLQVIPLDTEIRRDLGDSSYGLIVLAMGLIGGGLVMTFVDWHISGVGAITVVAGLIVAAMASIKRTYQETGSKLRRATQRFPAPRPGAVLEYQPAEDDIYVPKTPYAIQATAGFFAWLLGISLVIQAARTSSVNQYFNSANGIILFIGGVLMLLGGLAVWLRLRFKWRGFAPGLLLGFGLTCLVPVGIVVVVCGGFLK